ncbi:unnamed protein product [Miscanthus lutarioriparius]|uniref:Uncharacterized protein n=1 Tax=Miscanthus lutarioriparius TaxID=422564 RepID=A0A811MI56_9POAL|nr:unnamed protein product [Miscanthus lutarioriparius]
MVLMRSMATRRMLLGLPYEIVIEIAGLVAATSLHPMEDLCSLRGTCLTMRAACMERVIRSHVALEQEEPMRWFDPNRYLALIDKLATVGNPESYFMLGLRLVFTQCRTNPSALPALDRRPPLTTRDNEVEQYIRKVKGEGVTHGCKPEASRTNRECVMCREQAVDAAREVLWREDGMMDPVPVSLPEVVCKGSGYGVAKGWTGRWAVFCSDGYRIRHEYSGFFS